MPKTDRISAGGVKLLQEPHLAHFVTLMADGSPQTTPVWVDGEADGSSGLDAVNEILLGFEVPVVFITAFPERLLTGERPEPTFLITKPFDINTVRAVISQARLFDMHASVPGARGASGSSALFAYPFTGVVADVYRNSGAACPDPFLRGLGYLDACLRAVLCRSPAQRCGHPTGFRCIDIVQRDRLRHWLGRVKQHAHRGLGCIVARAPDRPCRVVYPSKNCAQQLSDLCGRLPTYRLEAR